MKIERIAVCTLCAEETSQVIGKTLTASRAEVFSWFCTECRKIQQSKHGGYYIPKDEIRSHVENKGGSLGDIPVFDVKEAPRCERCGRRGAELHHWAPREIFGDEEAELWPKDFLCVTCHLDWHGKINLSRRPTDE
jgi:hypothetical protein